MIADEAPTFVIYTNKSTLSYTATANNWKKLHPNFCDIFMIIDESRRLR